MNIRKTAAGILSAVMIAGCAFALPAETNPFVIVSEAAKKLDAPEISDVTADMSSVYIEWEEVEDADGYVIYRYVAAKKKYVAFDSVTDTSYTAEDLKSGTTYRFKVAAYIEKKGKKVAQKQTEMIKIQTEKLPGPTNITSISAPNSITLKWNSVDGIGAYRVYISEMNANKFKLVKTVTKTECTISGLEPQTAYRFKIESLAKSGSAYKPQGFSEEYSTATSQPVELSIPNFYFYDINEKEHKIAEFAGKPMILYFWSRHDIFIQDSNLQTINTLWKKYGDRVNFVVLNCDGRSLMSQVKKYNEQNGLEFTMYYDWDVRALDKMESNVTPYFVVIDATGNVIKTYSGMVNNDTIKKYVEKILEG